MVIQQKGPSMSMTLMKRVSFSGICFAAVGMVGALVAGCGSGGGSTSTTAPPSGDFSISASPSSVILGNGQSANVTVSVTEVNTFTSSVSVSVSGLPAGVTASPATFSIVPGSQQAVELNAVATAAVATATLTFQGTSGSLSHSATTSLSVVASVTAAHSPLRTQYLRTNSFYDPNSLQYSPPHFTAYDAVHKQFFVSNPYMNEIDVFSATQETEIATIPVPMAWGIDVSPYNGSLYAGTFIGDIYQIDTSTFSVTNRYPAASIGPDGFAAQTTLVLSDGRLALRGGAGGILGVDGFGDIAVWNSATNALDTGTSGSACQAGNEGTIALSGDRTRVLVTWVDESVSVPVCSYDPVTQVATYGSLPTPNGSFVREIAPTPDGTRFFLTTNLQGVAVFDAKTVQLLGQIPGTSDYTQLPSGASAAVVSQDGTTLYLINSESAQIATYDTTSLAQTGWVPSFVVNDSQSQIVLGAIDETGLIAGPIGHGVAFIDGSSIEAASPTLLTSELGSQPGTGPSAGGTALTGFLIGGDPTPNVTLMQMYAGNAPGVDASFAPSGELPSAQMTTPPSSFAGAVDLSVELSDGGAGVAPEAFSYGPTILEVVPNGATAEGGQTGAIIGYGFGDSTSGVQVNVGGQPASVTAVYNYAPIDPYPFPTNALQFTIPAGTAGTVADVKVTTPSGTATAAGAFHYTAATQSYPVTANLQAGIYDAGRDLYYFADQAQIQVLSTSEGKWLSPITLPGVGSNTQLLAISESPDGTELAVSDYGDQRIYVLNPDAPTSVSSYSMALDNDGFASLLAPDGLAATDAGMVYFDTNDIGGTGAAAVHKLNTAAGSITDLYFLANGDPLYPSSGGVADKFDRMLLSPDGSKVYTNIEGTSYLIDTANNQMVESISTSSGDGGVQDLAVSGDGSTVDINGFLTDPSLNPEMVPAYIDWETWFPTAVLGQKLNADGSILFQPLTDAIDMLSRNAGRLLYRVQIPVTPANVYDPIFVAGGQNTVGVITATGVTFVDLSSLPIAAQYTQAFPTVTHTRTGSLAHRQTAPPVRHAGSNRARLMSARPRLRHRLEKPLYSAKTP
jgi:hypothetical protein